MNLDEATVVEREEPALRSPLRARLAKWGRTAAAALTRAPTRLLPRSASREEGMPCRHEPVAQPVARPISCTSIVEGLGTQSILDAYRRGLLLEHGPDRIGWLSPARREAIAPQEFRIGSPLRRLLRDRIFNVSFDADFARVVAACDAAAPAEERLNRDLAPALLALHRDGHAHSVEVRSHDGALAGGLYGIAIGGVFFAEAKFEHAKKASAVALAVLHHHLNHWGFVLRSARWSPARGVHMVGREIFQILLDAHAMHEHRVGRWTIDPGLDTYAWSGRPRVACRRARNGSLPPLSAREMRIKARSAAPAAVHAEGGGLAQGA